MTEGLDDSKPVTCSSALGPLFAMGHSSKATLRNWLAQKWEKGKPMPLVEHILNAAHAAFFLGVRIPICSQGETLGALLLVARWSYGAGRGLYGAQVPMERVPKGRSMPSCDRPRMAVIVGLGLSKLSTHCRLREMLADERRLTYAFPERQPRAGVVGG